MIKDKTQALLDMVAGWAWFVGQQRERDENETDEIYERRLQDYPEAYEELVAELYQRVANKVDNEKLTPAEFLEQRVLPLLR